MGEHAVEQLAQLPAQQRAEGGGGDADAELEVAERIAVNVLRLDRRRARSDGRVRSDEQRDGEPAVERPVVGRRGAAGGGRRRR